MRSLFLSFTTLTVQELAMSDTLQLYQLQHIDSQMDALRKKLAHVEANLTETEALKAARAATQAAEQALQQARASMNDLDLEVKSVQAKIKGHQDRLYGGKVTVKEAHALQEDIAATKRWLAKQEDELLSRMIVFEEAEATLATCHSDLETITAAWSADQADLLAEKRKLAADLDKLQTERPNIQQFVDPADLTIYNRMRTQKGGLALSTVDEDNICSACGFILPYHLVQQAMDGDELCYCKGCQRIIHVF
jgi:predicted  nucleic acid-binding Zn-ribbon protein